MTKRASRPQSLSRCRHLSMAFEIGKEGGREGGREDVPRELLRSNIEELQATMSLEVVELVHDASAFRFVVLGGGGGGEGG